MANTPSTTQMVKLLLLALFNFIFTFCATAQGGQKLNCDNPQTQAEMYACASKAFQETDQKLNQIYKEVMAQLTPEQKTLLVKAQKSWLVVRDNHCKLYEHFYAGGSIMPLMVSNCARELTENRVKELQMILDELNMQ
ncbi:lysozyme inhibitor LprI family protein [Pontibacter pamirensis]|uniref:lysozyme inhibitor LprI family protein n=1 Tax=Pontibacter pamirensis TaxID=2562824 RepID=UPI00138A3C3B|nr:lysozyme inhibitor LprI family protein [Pontibacter pamirensis]